jgi:hypothetical protein
MEENVFLRGNNMKYSRKLFTLVIFGFSLFLFLSPAFAVDYYKVTNSLGIPGTGTLYQAITDANASTGDPVIIFEIPTSEAVTEGGATFWRIQPSSTLPTITNDDVIIDGASQTTWAGNKNPYGPEIEIDGSSIPGNQILQITADNCVINNLVINDAGSTKPGIFISSGNENKVYGCYIGTDATGETSALNGYGIYILGEGNLVGSTESSNRNIISGNHYGVYLLGDGLDDGNRVLGNFIGTDWTGQKRLANVYDGVYIAGPTAYHQIGNGEPGGGNVISANGNYGIYIRNASTNEVLGNYIGTNASGMTALNNTSHGVYVEGNDNLIGDGSVGGRNVISGNAGSGVAINAFVWEAKRNQVLGNYIGLASDGNTALGNSIAGVYLNNDTQYNSIGSTSAANPNVISSNGGNGIMFYGSATNSNEVLGNYIGTAADGSTPRGNSSYGIQLLEGYYNRIGDGSAAGRNIISANLSSGIVISGSNTASNEVMGNYIGTDYSGTANLGNTAQGIYLGSTINQIGPSNLIAYNGQYGVEVGPSINYIWITRNAMRSNNGNGIVLGSGANFGIAYPVITYASYEAGSGTTTVRGTSVASASIEVFKAEPGVSVGDQGEGWVYLGSTTAIGTNWEAVVTGVAGDELVTATASTVSGLGYTSEFGANYEVEGPSTTTTTTTTTTSITGTTTSTTATTTTTRILPKDRNIAWDGSIQDYVTRAMTSTGAARLDFSFIAVESGDAYLILEGYDHDFAPRTPYLVNVGNNQISLELRDVGTGLPLPHGRYRATLLLNNKKNYLGIITIEPPPPTP